MSGHGKDKGKKEPRARDRNHKKQRYDYEPHPDFPEEPFFSKSKEFTSYDNAQDPGFEQATPGDSAQSTDDTYPPDSQASYDETTGYSTDQPSQGSRRQGASFPSPSFDQDTYAQGVNYHGEQHDPETVEQLRQDTYGQSTDFPGQSYRQDSHEQGVSHKKKKHTKDRKPSHQAQQYANDDYEQGDADEQGADYQPYATSPVAGGHTLDSRGSHHDTQYGTSSSQRDIPQSYDPAGRHHDPADAVGNIGYIASRRTRRDSVGNTHPPIDETHYAAQAGFDPLYDYSGDEGGAAGRDEHMGSGSGGSYSPQSPISSHYRPSEVSHGPSRSSRRRVGHRHEAAEYTQDSTASMPTTTVHQQYYGDYAESSSSGFPPTARQSSIDDYAHGSRSPEYYDGGAAGPPVQGQLYQGYGTAVPPAPSAYDLIDEGVGSLEEGMRNMGFQEPLRESGRSDTQYTTPAGDAQGTSYVAPPSGSRQDSGSRNTVEEAPTPVESCLGSAGNITINFVSIQQIEMELDGVVDPHADYPLINEKAVAGLGFRISGSSKDKERLRTTDGDLKVVGKIELPWCERSYDGKWLLASGTSRFYVFSSKQQRYSIYLPDSFRGDTKKPEKKEGSRKHDRSDKHHGRRR